MPTKSWKTKTTLLLVSSLTIMSIITISPGLPLMASAFPEVPNSQFLVKLILTVPALLIAITAPLTGIVIDKKGRLRYLRAALLVYAISGSAGFYLDNLYLILVSRIILGISVGVTMTIAVTLVADYFDGHERQKFVGIQVAFMSIAGILFIGLGGVLADISWRFPFLIYLFSLLVLPFALIFLDEPEISSEDRIKSVALKAPKFIWVLFIHTMLMWIIFFLIPVQIPFFLESIGVEKKALIGAAIAMSTLFSAISSFSYSFLKDRFSFSSILSIGYILMGFGFLLIFLSGTYLIVVVAMMVCGLGIGIMIPNTNMWVMKIAPPEIRGREIGKLTTFWFFGQFVSPIVIGPFLLFFPLSSAFLLAAILLSLLSLAFLFYGNKSGV